MHCFEIYDFSKHGLEGGTDHWNINKTIMLLYSFKSNYKSTMDRSVL